MALYLNCRLLSLPLQCRLGSKIYIASSLRSIAASSNYRKHSNQSGGLTHRKTNDEIGTPSLGTKVKETSKTIWYTGIVVGGLLATGIILFTVLKELFWSQSPQSIYSDALQKCQQNNRICDILGEPIKGFGEESRRGRRNRVKYASYMKNGVEHLQIQFHIKGIRNQAKACADMEKINDRFEYYYLIAETENYPKEVIYVIDNRLPDISEV